MDSQVSPKDNSSQVQSISSQASDIVSQIQQIGDKQILQDINKKQNGDNVSLLFKEVFTTEVEILQRF
jgi:hypothetical protein